MGNTSTPYGALQAQLGYHNPFKINYVEVISTLHRKHSHTDNT